MSNSDSVKGKIYKPAIVFDILIKKLPSAYHKRIHPLLEARDLRIITAISNKISQIQMDQTQVKSQIRGQVVNQAGKQVREQVDNQVWTQLRDQMSQVGNQVWDPVWRQMWIQATQGKN